MPAARAISSTVRSRKGALSASSRATLSTSARTCSRLRRRTSRSVAARGVCAWAVAMGSILTECQTRCLTQCQKAARLRGPRLPNLRRPRTARRKVIVMAETLEELALQGDPGTLASEEQASRIQLLDPQQLYELWEHQQWLSSEIDFSQDKDHWVNLTDEEREWFVWGLASFFIGEERVTTQFSGLVMAYGDESEEAFLATQQVDEARHAQHFNRFYEQVLAIDGTFEDRLRQARGDLNDAFIEMFDGVLVDWGQRLIENPRDIGAKVDFVTLYHMIIEGTLAL